MKSKRREIAQLVKELDRAEAKALKSDRRLARAIGEWTEVAMQKQAEIEVQRRQGGGQGQGQAELAAEDNGGGGGAYYDDDGGDGD